MNLKTQTPFTYIFCFSTESISVGCPGSPRRPIFALPVEPSCVPTEVDELRAELAEVEELQRNMAELLGGGAEEVNSREELAEFSSMQNSKEHNEHMDLAECVTEADAMDAMDTMDAMDADLVETCSTEPSHATDLHSPVETAEPSERRVSPEEEHVLKHEERQEVPNSEEETMTLSSAESEDQHGTFQIDQRAVFAIGKLILNTVINKE